jgi:hypothetical protein
MSRAQKGIDNTVRISGRLKLFCKNRDRRLRHELFTFTSEAPRTRRCLASRQALFDTDEAVEYDRRQDRESPTVSKQRAKMRGTKATTTEVANVAAPTEGFRVEQKRKPISLESNCSTDRTAQTGFRRDILGNSERISAGHRICASGAVRRVPRRSDLDARANPRGSEKWRRVAS